MLTKIKYLIIAQSCVSDHVDSKSGVKKNLAERPFSVWGFCCLPNCFLFSQHRDDLVGRKRKTKHHMYQSRLHVTLHHTSQSQHASFRHSAQYTQGYDIPKRVYETYTNTVMIERTTETLTAGVAPPVGPCASVSIDTVAFILNLPALCRYHFRLGILLFTKLVFV